jgi:hypothetical protein
MEAMLKALVALYLILSAVLTVRTWGHYREPRMPGVLDLFRPELYTLEGLRRRKVLIRFCVIGASILLLTQIVSNFWL